MVMDSAKKVRRIISFKKFGMVRVKNKTMGKTLFVLPQKKNTGSLLLFINPIKQNYQKI